MAYDNVTIIGVTSAVIVITLMLYFKKKFSSSLNAAFLFKFAVGYNKRMILRKQRLFADLESLKSDAGRAGERLKIVEIGPGPGANFKFFPEDCDVIAIEPNHHFEQYLKINNDKFPHVHLAGFHVAHAEDMRDIQSESVDAVVCTLVLCSVRDVNQCLREIIRILRPGGKFFYMEHIAAPDLRKRLIQTIATIPWAFICDGCQMTRTTHTRIKNAGFRTVDQEEFEAKEMLEPTYLFFAAPLISPHLMGVATK